MNLSAAIVLYAGGPGSGCNPEAAERAGTQCGRPPKDGERGSYSSRLEQRYAEIMKAIKDPTAGTRKNPIEAGADLEKAAVLVAKGKHVVLDQPDQISTLVDKIKDEAEELRALGEHPPDWNLVDISVKGTNLFAEDHLGIPRVEMPQLAGLVMPGSEAAKLLPKGADLSRAEVDLGVKFIDELRSRKVKTKAVTVLASHLRASQSELDGAKVGSIADRIRSGRTKYGSIFVTRDNYILDGHHRWAAAIVNDARDGHMGDLWMSAQKLDIDIGTALSWARLFQKSWGLAPAGMGHVEKRVGAAGSRRRRNKDYGDRRDLGVPIDARALWRKFGGTRRYRT